MKVTVDVEFTAVKSPFTLLELACQTEKSNFAVVTNNQKWFDAISIVTICQAVRPHKPFDSVISS